MYPLNVCGPSAAHIGEFLKMVLKKDEPKNVQYLTEIYYVDSQCTQLSSSPMMTREFSLLSCRGFIAAQDVVVVPMIYAIGKMSDDEVKQ
jgi:hypothetical protein